MTKEIEIIDPKYHFVIHDSLENINFDVTYSVFKKYNCKAGCKLCYIRDDFLPDAKFKSYIPISQSLEEKSYIDRLMSFLSHFHMAATIDDMWFLKHDHPEHFRFYQAMDNVFWLSSMTDNAVFRHLDIIENDIKVKGLREISISEEFLYSVNINKLLHVLYRIQRKAKIMKVKIILQGIEDSNMWHSNRCEALVSWCRTNDVMVEKQCEYGKDTTSSPEVLKTLGNTRYSSDRTFTEETTYSENKTDLYPIHSESLFLMHDDFYSELKSATSEGYSTPFANLKDFDDPVKFLAKVLQGKVTDYARYVNSIQDKDNVYYQYFKYVVDNIKINPDFNFIPHIAMKNYTDYFKKIVESGRMVATQYGLLDPTNSEVIIPLYTMK